MKNSAKLRIVALMGALALVGAGCTTVPSDTMEPTDEGTTAGTTMLVPAEEGSMVDEMVVSGEEEMKVEDGDAMTDDSGAMAQ